MNTGKYSSILILEQKKERITFVFKIGKWGTWVIYNWLLLINYYHETPFKPSHYLEMISDTTHDLLEEEDGDKYRLSWNWLNTTAFFLVLEVLIGISQWFLRKTSRYFETAFPRVNYLLEWRNCKWKNIFFTPKENLLLETPFMK